MGPQADLPISQVQDLYPGFRYCSKVDDCHESVDRIDFLITDQLVLPTPGTSLEELTYWSQSVDKPT